MEGNDNVVDVENNNADDDVVFLAEINYQAAHPQAPRQRNNPFNLLDLDMEALLPREENEMVDLIVENLMQNYVEPVDIFDVFNQLQTDFNQFLFLQSKNPMNQPPVMRCIADHMDIETMKNCRLACKLMKSFVDPYFYSRGTFQIKNSADFYQFIKRPRTTNHLIPSKMQKVIFTEEIDLFEVSRIMYRGRSSLKEVSVITSPMKLRGEFQNIAGVLPSMAKMHTLRLNLPRRYLLHKLFKENWRLSSIETLEFNFENAQPATITNVFTSCTSLKYLEMKEEQVKSLNKLDGAPVSFEPSQERKVAPGMCLYKIVPKTAVDK